MTTTLYIHDRFITSLEELRQIVEEVGESHTQPIGRQLIAAACDGVIERWLQQASNDEESQLQLAASSFMALTGDTERWNLLKKVLTGKASHNRLAYRSLIELVAEPGEEQLQMVENGEKGTLTFQIRCRDCMDERVRLQLLDAEHWLDMNKLGVQTVSFEVDGSTYTGKVLELLISGESTPLWQKERGRDRYTFFLGHVVFEMIKVLGGKFWMGASDSDKFADSQEKPRHKVTLNDFYICETAVTQSLWRAVMGQFPVSQPVTGDDIPVMGVSWQDCMKFLDALNALLHNRLPMGKKFCLPTEAQWEFAARGRNTGGFIYSGSSDPDAVAWHYDNSSRKPHPVKCKNPNELGLYDMCGNVWEWCQDRFGDYQSQTVENPTGPDAGEQRVLRGGSYIEVKKDCRVSSRKKMQPDTQKLGVGLRLTLR